MQRGVELGYRVIDDYIKQGAAVANAFGGPRRTAPSAEDLPRMTQRMMQYGSDFTALWFDAMGMMMNAVEKQSAPRDKGQVGASDQLDPAEGRSRFTLQLRSSKAVEVIATFDEPLPAKLKVQPLRARSGSQTITDVAVEPRPDAGGPMKLRLHVPDRIKVGRYTGAIVNGETGQPAGRLTVIVSK